MSSDASARSRCGYTAGVPRGAYNGARDELAIRLPAGILRTSYLVALPDRKKLQPLRVPMVHQRPDPCDPVAAQLWVALDQSPGPSLGL